MLAKRFISTFILVIVLAAAGDNLKAYGQSIVYNNIGTQNIIIDEDLADSLQNLTGSNASRIISNGYLAKSAMLESAADLAANVAGEDYDGLTPFGSIAGQSIRYPSHLDVKGFSGITGLAYGGPMTAGGFSLGVFLRVAGGTSIPITVSPACPPTKPTAMWTTTAAACGAPLNWPGVFTATPGSGPAV